MDSPSFDPFIGFLRQQKAIRRENRRLGRHRNGLYRIIAAREYELIFDRGEVLDQRFTGFGLETPARGAFFVRCARADRPPEGDEIIAALGRITEKGLRPVSKPAYHLIGFLTPDGTVHQARRTWRGLHGRFIVTALPILALMLASLVLLADAPPAHIVDAGYSFRMVLFFVLNLFLFWLLCTKLAQRFRARRYFAQHIGELEAFASRRG